MMEGSIARKHKSGTRRKARELALQFLYQMDITKGNWKEEIELFWKHYRVNNSSVKDFALSLISGAVKHSKEIDSLITKHTINWDISRIAVIERNILRFAIYEILYLPEIPPVVSINEAIDIAKKYGAAESGKFVNGILDKVNRVEEKKA